MTSHFECTLLKVTKGRTVEHRISIDEITADERADKELLGKADGRDMGHCVYIGARYGESFLERVRWYYLSKEEDALLKNLRKTQPESVRVEFYGEKV